MLKNFYKSLMLLLEKQIFFFYFVVGFLWFFVLFYMFFFVGFFFNNDFFIFNNFLNGLDLLSFSNLHVDNFMSHFYLYKFNYYYLGTFYFPKNSLFFYPIFDHLSLPMFKKVIIYYYNSIFTFPFFEDGLVVSLQVDYGLQKLGFFYNYYDILKGKYSQFNLQPLFANYFFIDFYFSNSTLYYDTLYFCEDANENKFFWYLNYFHFYHFDYYVNFDYDLIVKLVYKSFSGDFNDFLLSAYSNDVSKD